MEKDWGFGIPNYTREDIMTSSELLNFAMQIVFDYELKPSGYEIVASNDDINKTPNFIVKKDGQLFFIVVKAAIAPDMPTLNDDEKRYIKTNANKYDAKVFFAPVGFASTDADRFSKGLALRGDGFYSNYCGLEEIM